MLSVAAGLAVLGAMGLALLPSGRQAAISLGFTAAGWAAAMLAAGYDWQGAAQGVAGMAAATILLLAVGERRVEIRNDKKRSRQEQSGEIPLPTTVPVTAALMACALAYGLASTLSLPNAPMAISFAWYTLLIMSLCRMVLKRDLGRPDCGAVALTMAGPALVIIIAGTLRPVAAVLAAALTVFVAVVHAWGSGKPKLQLGIGLVVCLASAAALITSNDLIAILLWYELVLVALAPVLLATAGAEHARRFTSAILLGGVLLLLASQLMDIYRPTRDVHLAAVSAGALAVSWALTSLTFPFHLPLRSFCTSTLAFIALSATRPISIGLLIVLVSYAPWVLRDPQSVGMMLTGGVVSALAGAVLATFAGNPMQRLGYLAMSDLAIVASGVFSGSTIGLAGASFATVNHVVAVALAALALHPSHLNHAGLRPVTSTLRRVAGTAGVLSLAGLPLTGGFPGRLMIFYGVASDGAFYALLLVAASAIAALAALRLMRDAFLQQSAVLRDGQHPAASWQAKSASAALAFGLLLVADLGLAPGMLTTWVTGALASLGAT